MVMRRYLRGRGFRSQLNHARLSGEPDIVMREYWTGYHSIAIMNLYLFGNFEQLNLIEEKDMRYTFCPTLLEKYEHPWTNGLSKASVSIGKTCSLYIRMRTRLSVLRSLVPIARIAFSMSVEHDAMGKLKKVLIFVLSRHIV